MKVLSENQRAWLPEGRQALSMLLTFALIGVLPFGQVQGAEGKGPGRSPQPVIPAVPAVTPIQHVIVIFGENRSFDHVFGTYVPAREGQKIHNLFSEGIVNADGTPGPHYDKTHQFAATNENEYEIHPGGKTLYANVPPILVGGPQTASDTRTAGDTGPFKTLSVAEKYEPNLDADYFQYLLTGATGLKAKTIDTRISDDTSLPSGVVQLTGPTLSYHDYASSPVHRFYQMWQQTDCSDKHATESNPSGCLNDLFPWVEVTIGAGSNGNPQALGFNDLSTGEGGTSVEFYNMQQGDVPYLKYLADTYTLGDNMHQGVMGGTGANHIMLGYADAMWYSDGNGAPATPPYNQIENPNPEPGTNNWYAEDGYSGGSYTDCSDKYEPGVEPIVKYLKSLPKPIRPNCDPGHYYLLNNYNPGYNADGTLTSQYSPFTIPPTSQPHIGDVLAAGGLSYTFFGEDWNIYKTDPTGANPYDAYCNICNPFQYATDIMTHPDQVAAHIQDMPGFFADVAANALPAVSIIQPSGFADGHPASSKLDIFEGFVKKVVDKVKASDSWSSTAIFVIFDEGGGYYDSGYIQPVDYFGDGTRMPFLIISPYTEGGYVNHSYADHVSIDKFIERNWNLDTISYRSRDNFPNPITKKDNPYVPVNSPAISDLFDAFHFPN